MISVGTITTTFHHPFYDITKAAFVDAQHLQPGDRLQQPGGVTATVLDVRAYHATHTTYDLTIGALHTYYVETSNGDPVLVHNCGDGAESESSLAAAEQARDQAGFKPDGTPNRKSPVYVGGYDAEGNVMGTGNGPHGSGLHAEDIVQEQMPGAQMTEPYAWRRNKITGELEWRPHTVCPRCQGKYPPTLFPPGTRGESGGAWGD